MNNPNLSHLEGFDWDQGNIEKNWQRHRVAFHECEEVFFHEPIIFQNPEHSAAEQRLYALGRTVRGRKLCISFTIRRNRIRVISARDMSRKERRRYGEAEKNSSV